MMSPVDRSAGFSSVHKNTSAVKTVAAAASMGTPVSSTQLKRALAHVAVILGGTLPDNIEVQFGESIRNVMSKLNEFRNKETLPKNLQEFEKKTKELDELIKNAKTHIDTGVKARKADQFGITPNQLRMYQDMAFLTFEAEFNTAKQTLGGELVQKEMVAIQTKLAELNQNTKLSNFLTDATDCSKKIKELEDVIASTGLKNTPSLDGLKTTLRDKFDGQLETIKGSEMDIAVILGTAQLVHLEICGDPYLKTIRTPKGGSETWLDKFKTEMTTKFNKKAEEMSSEIVTLSGSDVDGASALLSKLSAAVLSATESKSPVVVADGKSSAPEKVFGNVGDATTALAAATQAVAEHTLTTAVEENKTYLAGHADISAAVLKNPGAEAEKLRGRIANLESLTTAATAATDAGNTSASTEPKGQLIGILKVAEALHSVATAKGVADGLLKPNAKPTLEEVNRAIAGCKSAPAAPGSSPSAAHAAVTTLTAVLAAKRKVNEGFLVQLNALKGELTESKRLDAQVNDLQTGTSSDQIATLKRQLRPNSVSLSLLASVKSADRVTASQSALNTAQKAVVTGAIADIKTKLTLTSEEKLGTTDLESKRDGFKEALALLTQLKSPEIAIVTTAEIRKALEELDDLHSKMKTAIGVRTQKNMVDKTGEEPKPRLTSMTQALEFCKAFDVPSAHVEEAIRTVVDAQAKTLDAPLNRVLAAAQGPADLVLAIKALREAVKTVDLTLSGVPAKSGVMKNVAFEVEGIVNGVTWDFVATPGDKSRQSMASGLALITELSGIGAELGNPGWPTDDMNTKIGNKLRPIVKAQFESHHVGIVTATVTLEAIETRERDLKATSESMGGPHRDTNGQIGEFLTNVDVVNLERVATDKLKDAKIAVAKREVAKLKGDTAKPLDAKSMELMEKFAAILGAETDGTPADALALTKGDAATSCKVSELTEQLATPGSVTSIVRELGGLTHGDASHPRTDTAMTEFITAVKSPLPPADRIAINAALLKSALLPADKREDVKAALVEDMKAQWTIEMSVPPDLSSNVKTLESQFGKINDLGLPQDVQQELKTAAWGIAKETLGFPVVAIDLDNHLDPARTLDRLIKDSGDVVTIDGSIKTFVKGVKTAKSAALADNFTDNVAPTTVAKSVDMGGELSQLRSELIPGLDDGANSLSSEVQAKCKTKLEAVDLTANGTALETLFAVKCIMDNFPITEINVSLDAKIGAFLAHLDANDATVDLSIEHLDMFHQLTQRAGVDRAKVQTARTKVVTSWGACFSTRAKTANTTSTAGGVQEALVAEWDRFKDISQPRHHADMDSESIVDIKSTVAFFRIAAGKEDIKQAKKLAGSNSILDQAGANKIIQVLKADHDKGSDSQIPVSDKAQMYTKVTEFFDTLVAGVSTQGSIDQIMTTLQPKFRSTEKYSTQFTKATTQLVDLAELAKSFSELVPPSTDVKLSAADKAVIKLDVSIKELSAEYKALSLKDGKIVPVALAAVLQDKVTAVETQVVEIHKSNAERGLEKFSLDGKFDADAVNGLLDSIEANLRDEMKSKIDEAVAVNISKAKPTDAEEFDKVVTDIECANRLLRAAKIPVTNIETATSGMLDTQVKAFFDGVKITKANIHVVDDSALTGIETQLESLNTLAVDIYDLMGGALVIDAKAPKLEQLKVARLLNRVHNAGTPAGMEALATELRTRDDMSIAYLLKTQSFLYNVATGTGSGSATPLNQVIAQKALEGDPDEHKLAVMAQVLRSSKGAVVGDLTVAVFDQKMRAFVQPAPGVVGSDEDAMEGKLGRLKDFLAGVGDAAVQSLPAVVKEKITTLVVELGASSTAWAGCTTLVTALKGTLGTTAEQIAGAAAMVAFDAAGGTSPAEVKDALEGLQAATKANPAAVLPSDAKSKIESKLNAIVVPPFVAVRPNGFAEQIKDIEDAYALGAELVVAGNLAVNVTTELNGKVAACLADYIGTLATIEKLAVLGAINLDDTPSTGLKDVVFSRIEENLIRLNGSTNTEVDSLVNIAKAQKLSAAVSAVYVKPSIPDNVNFQKNLSTYVNAAARTNDSLTTPKLTRLRDFITRLGNNAEIIGYPDSVQFAIAGAALQLMGEVRPTSAVTAIPLIDALKGLLRGVKRDGGSVLMDTDFDIASGRVLRDGTLAEQAARGLAITAEKAQGAGVAAKSTVGNLMNALGVRRG